ncbi:hypothetical protein A2Z33_04400 [Candidatus Gottesmanbacteria bacterium RBG_16_52_11]|uniref:Uncharacterized protein n=1 Tax=Candidatus Gottesmanbacteria bacterium RBG_16_52_11 TaxID=1798374 RepID=A0A1F5YWC4_9BACT|nr:MAG: hypothetical protein A2Z33_04400 [Candidatus Gottesmanbacteria bacterium RBG_16_52_11]
MKNRQIDEKLMLLRDLGSMIQAELTRVRKDFEWITVKNRSEVLMDGQARSRKHISISRIVKEAENRFPELGRESISDALYSLIGN